MKQRILSCITALLAAGLCPDALSATFTLDQSTDVVAPSTRGSANTTHFGWEVFEAGPLDDSTPDIGTTTTGVNFKTTNGENHRIGSGNLYVLTTSNTLYEQVTVATSGTVGTAGVTTVIAQFVTASGDFPGAVNVSSINGVLPTVVRGVNAVGEGQVWAKWQLPGNAASYVFTVSGPAMALHYSMDRLVVDTHWAASAAAAQPDEMRLKQPLNLYTDLVVPSQRGAANTTYFGWDTFNDVGSENVPINDSTPDIGTTSAGVSFVTTNGQDHISSTRNLYVISGTLAEEVTVATSGIAGSGYTTVIAQAITAFGGFPGTISFGSINGVAPTVVQTTNSAGKGHVWAKWQIPSNAASYTFTISGPTGVSGFSFDKFVVDTYWNANSYMGDSVIEKSPPKAFTVNQVADVVAPSSRGAPYSTWFGWETFDEQGTSAPINDSTPNIGTTTTGVNFKTTNGEDHISGTGNIYLSNGTLAEEVTVVTNGPESSDGTTTIIAQLASGAITSFPHPLIFSSINGVEPVVVVANNSANRVQAWVKWVIPGNQESYTFTISGAFVNNPSTPYSIERVVIDTLWQPSGTQGDTMQASTPAINFVMDTVPDVVAPSFRGNLNTTWFGWETLNNLNARAFGNVINDSTPDIGTSTTMGANFSTQNGETHLLSSGNYYFFWAGTVDERITVPTKGTVGANGVTTIILQIASAAGGGFGSGFPGPLTFSSINGVEPTVVIGGNTSETTQVWAIWKVPGNQATYNIDIDGAPDQPHYSFDRIVVDTFWSATDVPTDTMIDTAPVEAGEIAFSAAAVSVDQGATTVALTVNRVDGEAPTEVTINTDNGTSSTIPPFTAALAGTDYTDLVDTATTVSFDSGETTKTVNVTLIPKTGTAVPNKRFTATLSAPTAGATLGSIATTTVQILANDTVKPTLTVTAPMANANIGSSVPYLVKGTAGDAKGLDRVEVVLNSGAPVAAVLGSATANTSRPFSLEIEPAAGANTLVVTAYDLQGNSTTVTRSFNFTLRYTLSVARVAPVDLDSAGTVAMLASPAASASALTPATANANPKTSMIVPSTTVKLTATAKAGYTFSHWSGAPSGAVYQGNVISFTMPSANVSGLTATFVVNPFNAPVGSGQGNVFYGLIHASGGTEVSNASEGFVTGTLTPSNGLFSGKVLIDGISQSFMAYFYGNGNALFTVGTDKVSALSFGSGKSLTLSYASNQITATVTAGSDTSVGVAGRGIYSAANKVPAALLNQKVPATAAANNKGLFTLGFPSKAQDPVVTTSTYPQGDGFGSITLSDNGTLTLSGTLADGSLITGASGLVTGNAAPIFVQVTTPGAAAANKGGSFSGVLTFDATPADSDISGTDLLWLRPAVTAVTTPAAAAAATNLYTAGWPSGIKVDAVGALYDKTLTVQTTLSAAVTTSANADLLFTEGKLTTPVAKGNINITDNKVTKLPATDASFTLAVTQSTGGFTGTFTPVWANANTVKPGYKGIMVQKGASKGGYGFFLSNAKNDLDPESGGVTLSAKPE